MYILSGYRSYDVQANLFANYAAMHGEAQANTFRRALVRASTRQASRLTSATLTTAATICRHPSISSLACSG